jgi:CBS domain-containing protein
MQGIDRKNPLADDPTAERGERIETGKVIARGGKKGFVPGAMRSKPLKRRMAMQVSEVMTRNVECARPTNSVFDVARQMKKLDVGALPVCGDNDRLVGIVTDRDIVLRGVAEGRNLDEVKVQDIMTPGIEYCVDDQPVKHAAQLMREKQIRRLVVLNDDHRLVGIVSLGDLAVDTDDEMLVGSALEGISQPSEPNR